MFFCLFRLDFSHRLSPQLKAVRVVYDPVQDRVGQGVVSYRAVPLAHRELAYHHRRTLPVTVVHDLHQVVSLGLAKLLKTPVVYDQKPCFPKLTQKLSVTSVGLGLREGKKQP